MSESFDMKVLNIVAKYLWQGEQWNGMVKYSHNTGDRGGGRASRVASFRPCQNLLDCGLLKVKLEETS